MPGVVIGLTGGLATGKSTLAAYLRRGGAATYSVDDAAHALYRPGGPLAARLASAFGAGILDRAGAVDRARLGSVVIGNRAALRRLEGLVHPVLAREAAAAVRRLAARHAAVAVEAGPLLFALGLDRLARPILLTRCGPGERMRRLTAARRLTVREARRLLRAFADAERRLERAARGRAGVRIVRTDVPAERLAALAAALLPVAAGH